MIRINFVTENRPIERTGAFILLGSFLAAVFGIITLVALNISFTSSVARDELRLTQLSQQLSQLQEQTKEVKGLETKKNEIDDKLAIIARLKLSKRGPVRLLDDLNVAVPERLWVTELQELDGELTVSGAALDDASIVQFSKDLQRSPHFLFVGPPESTQAFLVFEDAMVQGGRLAVTKIGEVLKLKNLEQLSPQQKEAVLKDLPGGVTKVRSFKLTCRISYVSIDQPKAAEGV